MNPTNIARCAQLAMVLDVSATPKPGNIDRDHDYSDTRFEHFLASAVGVYPVLEEAARSDSGVGSFIRQAVLESARWQRGGNTHFGAFILLVPLVIAGGACDDTECLRKRAEQVVKETTVDDAVELYKAFSDAKVRVKPVGDLDLSDSASVDKIKEQGLTLFDMMEMSAGYDIIAGEWVNGFSKTFECARLILEKIKTHNINDAVVFSFMEMLARNKDTFIRTKFDSEKAEEVSRRAAEILKKSGNDVEIMRNNIHAFDRELLDEGVNPGSTADIIIAGLFVALFGGMRF